MSQKVYINLLVLCGFVSHGILGTFLENNYDNSTNLHCRKKRMLEPNADAIYITKIILGRRVICTAAIVSPKYVLAVEECYVTNPRRPYYVFVGVRSLGPVSAHDIKGVHVRGSGALALFELYDPMDFVAPSMNRPMPFYERNVRSDMPFFNIYSWTPDKQRQIVTRVSMVERSENPSLRDDEIVTAQMHGNFREINDYMDVGAPLAVGQHLVGILVTPGTTRDIFTVVRAGTEHHTWIMGHIYEDLQTLVNGQH